MEEDRRPIRWSAGLLSRTRGHARRGAGPLSSANFPGSEIGVTSPHKRVVAGSNPALPNFFREVAQR